MAFKATHETSSAGPAKPIGGEQVVVDGMLKARRHVDRNNRRAVVFVHGFTGDQDTTWTNVAEHVQFDSLLFDDEDLADYDVFKFKFASKLYRGNDVDGLAQRLGQAINELQASRRDGGRYEAVLVAHSLGGLICMRYILNNLIANQIPPVVGLMLYATPTTGTGLVTVAKWVLDVVAIRFSVVRWVSRWWLGSQKQLNDLETASAFLGRLQTDWAARVLNGGDPAAGLGRMWLPVRVVSAERDGVVSESSAKGAYGAIDWLTLDYNHVDVCKPATRTDDRYLAARRFLEACRDSKGPSIQQDVWTLSQRVWEERRKRLVKRLEYLTSIHADGDDARPVDPVLVDSGFTPCITHCKFSAILRPGPVTVGIAFGLGGEHVWKCDPEPEVVHALSLGLVPTDVREQLRLGLKSVMSRGADSAWKALLPVCEVKVDGRPLVEDAVERAHVAPYEWMRRRFLVPADLANRAGEEVVYELKYQSIVPDVLAHFRFVHRWITNGSTCRITVNRKLDYLVATSALGLGQKASESKGDDGRSVEFSTQETLLPGAQFAASWWLARVQD
ncbi:alpha/beta fold hydrolase [Paludisphaera mucosa]|uniref:Alpha/beta hydrolase n=1 Tax=Paludisphaera mucosa TaxID=3030827 RepID=A0ABT6F8D9_9BACT|nr:alpha/beta fold hydrolase [Paludisphaera mucosa]MDG3003658.1 alpha/beta hydrolase [Paludisphaera mucosa]